MNHILFLFCFVTDLFDLCFYLMYYSLKIKDYLKFAKNNVFFNSIVDVNKFIKKVLLILIISSLKTMYF